MDAGSGEEQITATREGEHSTAESSSEPSADQRTNGVLHVNSTNGNIGSVCVNDHRESSGQRMQNGGNAAAGHTSHAAQQGPLTDYCFVCQQGSLFSVQGSEPVLKLLPGVMKTALRTEV